MQIKEGYIVTARELLGLAKQRRLTYKYHSGTEKITQTKEHNKVALELDLYLNTLTLEEIQFLQALMHLGRDTTDKERREYPAIKLFESQYKTLIRAGLNNKELGADQLFGKMPLDEYLEKGLEIISR